MNSTLRDFWVLLLVTGGLFAGIYTWIAYSGNPANEAVEQQNESLIGVEMEERLAGLLEEQFRFIENEATRELKEELNRRFSPHPGQDILVIDDDQVNAFTTVGDRVYLFRGLVTYLDEPELIAAVVAHELGHIHHNHVEDRLKLEVGTSVLTGILTAGNQGMLVELGRTMMGLSYSRSQELEADDFALELLKQADIHPQNLSRAFLRFKSLDSSGAKQTALLSTHPSIDERITRILDHEIPEGFSERPLDLEFSPQQFQEDSSEE